MSHASSLTATAQAPSIGARQALTEISMRRRPSVSTRPAATMAKTPTNSTSGSNHDPRRVTQHPPPPPPAIEPPPSEADHAGAHREPQSREQERDCTRRDDA